MARYMLDTDTCSYIMKRSSEAVIRRLRAVPVADVCISVITKSELLYGVEVSPRRTQGRHRAAGVSSARRGPRLSRGRRYTLCADSC